MRCQKKRWTRNLILADAPAVRSAAGFSQDNKAGRLLSSVGSAGMKSSCKQQIFHSLAEEKAPELIPAVQHLVPS